MKEMTKTVTEGLSVVLLPNAQYEFLMTNKEVAKGYGVTEYAIRKNKLSLSSELTEGKHFVKGVTISNTLENAQPHQVFWTKRGVIRLGFAMRSERAKLFRDWVEDLIIGTVEGQLTLFEERPIKQLQTKRNHNRLTSYRLNEIMREVCKIEDTALRMSITEKLYNN